MSVDQNQDSPLPPWQNAPTLFKLASVQQGGSRGAQLWGVQNTGKLTTIYQVTPGGDWSQWMGPDWAGRGYPMQVYELGAAQHSNGWAQIWILDESLRIWTTVQTSPGGNWAEWDGPMWNDTPAGMKRVAACQQGGSVGARLWGITDDYGLLSCYGELPGGGFTGWKAWDPTPDGSGFSEVTAAQQNDGRVQLWALDTNQRLWSCWQTSPGPENWTAWSEPSWGGAPRLVNVAACQQGGSRGAQVWGVTPSYALVSNYQVTPGGGWSGWSTGSWLNAPPVHEITAAQQNNGCVRLWAVTTDQVLVSIAQTSPGGDWTGWS